MNFKEAKEKCNSHGIYQLNHGESLADALDHIENGTQRKGYRVKFDSGRAMTKNQIIANENRIAFRKSFTPPVYAQEEVELIDDISSDNDFREDRTERGVILNCFYCGECLRIDYCYSDGDGDYGIPQDTIHCESCMNAAISRLAM